ARVEIRGGTTGATFASDFFLKLRAFAVSDLHFDAGMAAFEFAHNRFNVFASGTAVEHHPAFSARFVVQLRALGERQSLKNRQNRAAKQLSEDFFAHGVSPFVYVPMHAD